MYREHDNPDTRVIARFDLSELGSGDGTRVHKRIKNAVQQLPGKANPYSLEKATATSLDEELGAEEVSIEFDSSEVRPGKIMEALRLLGAEETELEDMDTEPEHEWILPKENDSIRIEEFVSYEETGDMGVWFTVVLEDGDKRQIPFSEIRSNDLEELKEEVEE